MKRTQAPACLTRVLLAIFACLLPLHAENALDAGAKDVKKTVVTDSVIGYRDTVLFYVFAEAKAVLVVGIGNKNLEFPVSAKLHKFAAGTASPHTTGNSNACGWSNTSFIGNP